ncbi:hypothetical protein HHI36_007139 [Cryptolaemus montrouzieri]|uniref:G domain-containing protein n=1 Tax=Cryptolaemus montrouzieri TaxID=559131 RepID=A0ABD2MNL9_9CUCU
MAEKLCDLQLHDMPYINILLLGERGVGKSTFINSIANYLRYQDFQRAIKEPHFVLIPCSFNIRDDKSKIHKVTIESNNNGCLQVDDSSTQDIKTYEFSIRDGKTTIRLIDTPGISHPIGVKQNDINCANILSYIGQLHKLHAICFLFKPIDLRANSTFEYYVTQILSKLEKSAAKNIIFLFTNTKKTEFKPGKSIGFLKKSIEVIKKDPPHVDIEIKENVFCFDNEAFRYIGAVKKGISFEKSTEKMFSESWKNSTEQACKLIHYIMGDVDHQPLLPYFMKDSTSINEARIMINQLAQPLADILQLIFDNLRILDNRYMELTKQNLSLDQLKSKLYVPIIHLKCIKLTQPATVCCDPKCAELLVIERLKTWSYKQRCHDPCYLKNVSQNMIGAPQLLDCTAMNKVTRTCSTCSCPHIVHMHVYYMTEKCNDKKIMLFKLKSTQTPFPLMLLICSVKAAERFISFNDKICHFLQHNDIISFNEAFKKSIFPQLLANAPYWLVSEVLIIREKSFESNADQKTIHYWQSLMDKYDETKSTFDKIVQLSASLGHDAIEVDAKCILEQLEKLYALKHNGMKIQELYLVQNTSRKTENSQNEQSHSSSVLNIINYENQTQSDKQECNTPNVKQKEQIDKKKNKIPWTRSPLKSFERKIDSSDKSTNTSKEALIDPAPQHPPSYGHHGSSEDQIHSQTFQKDKNVTIDSSDRSSYTSKQRHIDPAPHIPPSYDHQGSSHCELYNNQYTNGNRAFHDKNVLHENGRTNNNQLPRERIPSNGYRMPHHNDTVNNSVSPYDHRQAYDSRVPYNSCSTYDNRRPYNGCYGNRHPYHDSAMFHDNWQPDNIRPSHHITQFYGNGSESRYPRPHLPESRHLTHNTTYHDTMSPYDNQSFNEQVMNTFSRGDDRQHSLPPSYDCISSSIQHKNVREHNNMPRRRKKGSKKGPNKCTN